MQRINAFIYIVAFLVVIVVGLAFMASGAYQILNAIDSQNWMTVPGIVTYSRTEIVVRKSGNGTRPVVKYTYTVNGIEYIGDRITYGHAFDTAEYADAKAAEYPVGRNVTVYYDPDDPSYSCLETDNSPLGHLLMIGGGAVLACLGFYFLRSQLRSGRSLKKER